MDTKQFHRRVWAVVVLLAMIITGLGASLYDLQINHGEAYYSQSQSKIAETETVEAGRGQILDRNGRILVSDKAVYQVTLNTALMGDARNDTILSLIQVSRETGVTWGDSLPISAEAPFVFTTADPYYTAEADEDGVQAKTLTRLGRLAVKLKWIEDPTQDPQPEPETAVQPKEPGLWDKIKGFFSGSSAQPDSQEVPEEEQSQALPGAEGLLDIMCAYFKLEEDALDRADIRAVVGVLYELDRKSVV